VAKNQVKTSTSGVIEKKTGKGDENIPQSE